jgi:hypothetical protein
MCYIPTAESTNHENTEAVSKLYFVQLLQRLRETLMESENAEQGSDSPTQCQRKQLPQLTEQRLNQFLWVEDLMSHLCTEIVRRVMICCEHCLFHCGPSSDKDTHKTSELHDREYERQGKQLCYIFATLCKRSLFGKQRQGTKTIVTSGNTEQHRNCGLARLRVLIFDMMQHLTSSGEGADAVVSMILEIAQVWPAALQSKESFVGYAMEQVLLVSASTARTHEQLTHFDDLF